MTRNHGSQTFSDFDNFFYIWDKIKNVLRRLFHLKFQEGVFYSYKKKLFRKSKLSVTFKYSKILCADNN